MNTQATTSLSYEIVVNAPVQKAFDVFTRDFGKIKPKEHNLLGVPISETVFEPRAGGHIFDRGQDGSECRWSRVLAYEPPARVLFTWDISPRWSLETDEARASVVEVRFTEDAPNRTRVTLEHRDLDNHLEGWESLREGVSGQMGWPLYLNRFAELIESGDG